jgi:hypothetical protein
MEIWFSGERVIKIEIIFYSSGGWESDGPRRVTGGDGIDSILQFRLEMGDDGTNHCRKMKRMQRTHLGAIRRKRDTARWHDTVDRRRGCIR